MKRWLENFVAHLWNRKAFSRHPMVATHALDLGLRISDGETNQARVTIPQNRRAEHVAILGKTGTGKSSLMCYQAIQDIEAGRGLFFPDQHGDATPYFLRYIAALERATNRDLSGRTIVIDPADPEYSVGMNLLEQVPASERFVQIAELSQVVKQRCHLESFGPRTDELLRNSLFALAESGHTIVELAPFLSHAAFRDSCVKLVTNPEVKQYFELRYNQVSEPMRATMREPILNKTSAFTADPRFRHIVGQQRSTFSILEAIDRGYWIFLHLPKGRLGEQATTLASLYFTTIKNALFSRTTRELFTLYCDEIQNLVAYGNDLEMVLSEARKFGICVTSANQYLDQYSPEMRAAILAVGTHIFFQLSPSDAQHIAGALDGGKPLAELLKNLPRRHLVVKTGHERPQEAIVPTLSDPRADSSDLYNRCRERWARKRSDIEEEISRRQSGLKPDLDEELNGWE